MINGNEEYHSRKLKEIVKKSGHEYPSDRFTDNVMKAVREAHIPQPSAEQVSWFRSGGFITVLAVILGTTAVAYFFYLYGNILFVKDIDPVFGTVLKDLYHNLTEIIDAIKISSITMVIIGGLIILLGLEYFLRKFQSTKNSYLLF